MDADCVTPERSEAVKLADAGYRWEVTARGYMVWHGDRFVHGAGIKGEYKGRGGQVRQQREANRRQALRVARQDMQKRGEG